MVNKVQIIGRVGQQPETRKVGESQVTTFSLAASEKYTNKAGEKVEETEWFNIVMWRKLAEIAVNYVNKGDLLYIEGKLKTRSWEDKDGNKRYMTEVVADQMKMLGGKGSKPEPSKAEPENFNEGKSDLPF